MSDFHSKRCDECGALRGETNHWWAVIGSASQPRFLTSKEADARRRNPFRLDYCSHKCVGTAFHRWMDTATVAKTEKKAGEDPAAPEENATLVDVEVEAMPKRFAKR